MANDLKTIPRQFITQPMDLGHTDAFTRIQNSLNQLSDYAAGEAGKLFLEEARKRGEQKAFENIGKPQKGALPLTAATKVENEAYLSATAKLLTVKLNSLMEQNTRTVQDSIQSLGQKALPRLQELNDATMQGFLQNVPDELKHDMQYQFILGKEKTTAYMMDQVSRFNNERAADSFATTFGSDLNNLKEKIFSGNHQGAVDANSQAEKTLSDYKQLGKLSLSDEAKFREKLAYTITDSYAVAGFLQARAKGPDSEAAYLHEIATSQPTGTTREQWVSGQSAIAKEITRLNKLEVEHVSYIRAEIENGIATGSIATEDDLQQYYNKLPASEIMGYRTKMLKANDEDAKLAVKVKEYNELKPIDPVKASMVPDNVRDAAFEQALDPILQEKRLRTGDPNAQLTLREMVPTARGEPAGNRLFTARMEYGLKSNIPAIREDAILAYKDLNGQTAYLTRAPALDVDATSDRIAFRALSLAEDGREPIGMAIERAQKEVLLINDNQRIANIEAYKAKFVTGKSGVKNFNKAFKDASGVNAEANPFAAKIFRDMLSGESEYLNTTDAQNLSTLKFKQSFSQSSYNKNPNQVMQFAPELVVPKATQGRWLQNQELLTLYGIVKDLESVPIAKVNLKKNMKRVDEIMIQAANTALTDNQRKKLNDEFALLNKQIQLASYNGPVVKWNMGKLKDKYTEQELMSTDLLLEASRERMALGRGGTLSEEQAASLAVAGALSGLTRAGRRPTVTIDGVKREVYLGSSTETMNRADGKKIYSFLIDNGIGAQVPLPNPLNQSGNPAFNGNATFLVRPFEEFLPRTSQELNSKTMAQITEKERDALFRKDNPLSFFEYTFNREEYIKKRRTARNKFVKGETNERK